MFFVFYSIRQAFCDILLDKMKKIPYVLIDLPGSIVTHRQMLMGIHRYVQLHGPWFTQIIGFDSHLSSANALNTHRYDGAIVDIENGSTARAIGRSDIPVVQITPTPPPMAPGSFRPQNRLYVSAENFDIGCAAARFLLARGYRNFAFLGIDRPWSQLRQDGFADTLRHAGHSLSSYRLPATQRNLRQLSSLQCWIGGLPKPTALFAANDPLARQVNNVIIQAGIAMPEEISILGVDNDPIFCESTTPPISSLRLNTKECGFNMARALEQMMNGQPSCASLSYGFAGVEERMSTNVFSHKDPLVATASRILSDRITAGKDPTASVSDIAHAANASLRALEVRFKAETGRTLHEEMTRLRFERAQKLLRDGKFTIAQVARLCGYATPSHFSVVYKRISGMTPRTFREQGRA